LALAFFSKNPPTAKSHQPTAKSQKPKAKKQKEIYHKFARFKIKKAKSRFRQISLAGMGRTLRLVLTYISVVCGVSACALFDKDEEIPSLIQVDEIKLITNPATQGTATHKITDAWLFVDDNSAGTYEMPFVIPFLGEGKRKLTVEAGIKNNGISKSRVAYPFYKDVSLTEFPLIRGEISKVNVEVSYIDNLDFRFIDDFEDIVTQLERGPGSAVNFQRINHNFNPDLYGAFVAYVKLEKFGPGPIFNAITKERFVLPKLMQNVYLEMDFRCDHEFSVGLLGYYPDGRSFTDKVITLNPTIDKNSGELFWNKIYIDLTRTLNLDNANPFQIVVQADLNSTANEANIWLDNIKLIHRKQ
jgi:hypothetical protein